MKYKVLMLGAVLSASFLFGGFLGSAQAKECKLTPVVLKYPGEVSKDRSELSGVVVYGDRLIVISNEGLGGKRKKHDLQVFKKDGAASYQFVRDERLYRVKGGSCKEADFEALALDGKRLYAVTSHSVNRKKQKPTRKSYKNNRKRLSEDGIEGCDARYQLRSVKLSKKGKVKDNQAYSLKSVLKSSFGGFTQIPNKENGVDIEGLAVRGGHIYVGFRGPVFRQNYTPILKLDKDLSALGGEVLHVKLDGRGVRGLTEDGGDFVILAGPNGDEGLSFRLYAWNGEDDVGGKRRGVQSNTRLLCELPDVKGAKPEGIAMLTSSNGKRRALLVYDSDGGLVARIAEAP